MRGFHGAPFALVSGDDRPRLRKPHALDAAPAPEPTRWTPEREASPSIQRALLLAADALWRSRGDGPCWLVPRSPNAGLQARLLLTLLALDLDDGDRADRLADGLLDSQLPDGGWAGSSGSDSDHAASVLAYLAIKLHRGAAALPQLRETRQMILAHGGAGTIGDEPYAWLALFRQAPARDTAGDQVWSDAIAAGIERQFDALHGVRELFIESTQASLDGHYETKKLCRAVMLLWRRLGLDANESEVVDAVEQELESLIHDEQSSDGENGAVHLAPETTSELDTAQLVEALSPLGYREELGASVAWLAQQVEQLCEQQDIATVAATLRAFATWRQVDEPADGALPPRLRIIDEKVSGNDKPAEEVVLDVDSVVRQLATWLVEQQPPAGSWGDVPTTATVVSALVAAQLDEANVKAAIEQGVVWLSGEQSVDGGWLANTQVTAAAVGALTSAGEEREAALAGVNWLLAEQLPCGGWGATKDASPTATASALEAIAADQPHADAAARAANVLLNNQPINGLATDPVATCATIRALTRWVRESRGTPVAGTPVRLRVVAAAVETEAAYA